MIDFEQLTDDVMDLRADINLLSEAMMKNKILILPGGATDADAKTIENARLMIQQLTRELSK